MLPLIDIPVNIYNPLHKQSIFDNWQIIWFNIKYKIYLWDPSISRILNILINIPLFAISANVVNIKYLCGTRYEYSRLLFTYIYNIS